MNEYPVSPLTVVEWAGCRGHQRKTACLQEWWLQTLDLKNLCGHGRYSSQKTAFKGWWFYEVCLFLITHIMCVGFPAYLCCSWRRLQQRKGEEILSSGHELNVLHLTSVRFRPWESLDSHSTLTTTINTHGSVSSSASCVFPVCQNFVVAVGAEGWFHLFDLTAATTSKADSSSQHESVSSDDQRPFFTQHIPANTKVILISDIGKCLFYFIIYYVCIWYSYIDLTTVCACLYWRWWRPLWAGGGIHRPRGASFPLGGALW